MSRFHRALLHCYPASFRREYGAEMETVLAERLRAAGYLTRLGIWFETVVDTLTNAAAVHVDLLRHDLRYARRTLLRQRGFALAVIAVVAIGVGANTAAFSVADFALLHPLAFPDPDRIVTLYERPPGYNGLQATPPNYRDWRQMAHSFSAMGAYHTVSAALTGAGAPQELGGIAVHGDLLSILGARPLLGHLFSAGDYRDGTATVLLSEGLWRTTFGGDPGIVGRTVVLDGTPYTVSGVLPKTFVFPNRTATFWQPMKVSEFTDNDRTNSWFDVVARLAPGVTLPQAQHDMDAVANQLARSYPAADSSIGIDVFGLRDTFMHGGDGNQSRLLLLALCGASLLVLLIGCANLANLLLVRAVARRRELAVRTAVGAATERLVRQLVTESLLLAVIGGIAGTALAVLLVPALAHLVPPRLPLPHPPTVNITMLLLAALLTVVIGVGFGTAPAIRAGRGTSLDALRDGSRASGGRKARLRAAFVVVQLVMSIVLLTSTGLLLRSIWNVQQIDPGFRPGGVLTLHTVLPYYKYGVVSRRTSYYRQVLDGVRAIPGVQSAGYITRVPMTMGGGIWPVLVPGAADRIAADNTASLRYVTPGYLETMRIPLERGRAVSTEDTRSSAFTAVVSESFARRYWPDGDPIGRKFTFAFYPRTVVGVVGDVKVRGLERSSEPQVYLPYQQVADSMLLYYAPSDLAVRSTLSPAALIPAVRRVIHQADPDLPITDIQTMDAIVAQQTAARTAQVRMLAAFAVIAFLLGAVGIHGVLAFTVSQRRQEFGIRMALGAQAGAIFRMVAREGLLLVAAGVIPGVVLAYAAARVMGAVLAGVAPDDPLTYGAVVSLAVVMVVIGVFVPARRALEIEPAQVIRVE
jgi:putative ABC transport system permease protein